MLETSRILLRSLATELSAGISPSRWDVTIDDAVSALARISGDALLEAARAPVAIFLEGASSGAGLDLAYGTSDSATELNEMCLKLVDEIQREREWFACHPQTWASSLAELREVLGEFDRLTDELRRVAAAAC